MKRQNTPKLYNNFPLQVIMAGSSTSATLCSSDETCNGTKLMRLILDGGTEALRIVLRNKHSGNLQVVLSCTCSSSTCTSSCKLCNYHILSKLKGKIIKPNQWNKLYPGPTNPPNINDFDITLLSVLLRNICSLSAPPLGWDNMPNSSDLSEVADIIRIKLFRNERFGHKSRTAVSMADFKKFWAEMSLPLVRLGIDQKEIHRLENEECGKEEVERVVKEWNECDNKIVKALEETNNVLNENLNVLNKHTILLNESCGVLKDVENDVKTLVEKSKESRSDGVLNKHLVCFDFQREIELYDGKFTRGTREWVFEQISTWFNNETSKNRSFIICALAGMGKSVIAAVICKRFAEHIGASHFFQYNNSQYNNPNFFLQSLAWHLCKVIPAYKEALIEKLSGNLGKSLNDMDIEGLFSTLFKEPFSGISDPGKRILIVLDAVDESEYYGREELAKLISNHLHKLPFYLRFLITTRPEKKLLNTFTKLNPLFIEANDERNLNDIKLVLEDKIPSSNHPTAGFINSLAQKSNGLMLYAFFLTEMYQDNVFIHDMDSLPTAVEECYENYFKRLEKELELLKIPKDKFLGFLSALAVANEPLPEVFVGTLFGFENPADTKQKVAKATNVLSSLLVIQKDKSISFFHKSLRDWVVDNSLHDYSVNVQYGHKILVDLCVKKLDDLKRNGVSKEGIASTDIKYALKYWISHMLEGLEDAGKLEGFVGGYVIDLEVMFASVCVNVNVALGNLIILKNHEMFEHAYADTRSMVRELHFLIRKSSFSLRQYPQTFLQNVVNEGGKQLSSNASTLLQTRYKDILYFQLNKQDKTNDAIEARCHLSGMLLGIDVSPKHDYVVCGYTNGEIELFSLATGMPEWKIHADFTVKFPSFMDFSKVNPDACMLSHIIVFHPRKNLILPGRLDEVLTFLGTRTTGPFHCDEGSSVFNNCCTSMDGSRMVTNCDEYLFVWNVSNGRREKCFSCNNLCSFSFTASGNFLGTIDDQNVFTVYDVTNDYDVNSTGFESVFPVEIVSTFEQNSWLCSVGRMMLIVDHDLVLSSSDFGCIEDIALPTNVHCSRELQFFFQHPEQSWLSRIRKKVDDGLEWSNYTAIRYTLIGGKSVLVFSRDSNIIRLFSLEGLIQTSAVNINENVISNISTTGEFVYLSNHSTKHFSVCKLGSQDNTHEDSTPIELVNKLDFVVVKSGVIFYSKGHACIPELWNSDVTKCLSSFDQLAGTKECMLMSDEVIACVFFQTRFVHKFRIVFFNVLTEHIENKMSFGEGSPSGWAMHVHACSIKYHVLTEEKIPSLWKDGKKMDDWDDLLSQAVLSSNISSAEFSPEANKLAISCWESNNICIFDVASTSFLAQIAIGGPELDIPVLKFFDNENLLCGSDNNMLYSININRREILTCLDIGDKPNPISVCSERNVACVGLNNSKKIVLVEVCLPRTEA
jgi:hypothetical protein